LTRRLVYVALYFLLGTACTKAQVNPAAPAAVAPAKNQDPLNRETPQSAVVSFLEACHAESYAKAAKYFDLRNVASNQRLQEGPELAKQLALILDRDVQFDVASLSRNPEGTLNDGRSPGVERVDSFEVDGRKLDLELQRVTRRSGSQVWLFSAPSVALIPQIAHLTSDSPIERHLPAPLVNLTWMSMALWRWIALALAMVFVTAASRLVGRLILRVTEPLLHRIAPSADRRALDRFVGPLQMILAVAAFRVAIDWVGVSPIPRLYLERGVTLLLFCGVAALGGAIIELIVARLRVTLEARHQAFSYSVLPIGLRVAKLTIWAFAITAVLSNWGYNTTTILAGLGVGGLAIALAAQKTIENLFGGVSVISDRPVSVGDFCKFGDRSGTVEDIGLRSTRVRTPDRTLVTVPNGQFSSMTLENFSQRDKMLFHVTLNLRRDTSPEQVRTLLASVTKILKDHPKVEAGTVPVRFIGVGSYSLDVEIFAYVITRSGDEFLQMQQDLLLSILDAVESAGTALALPTQANISYPTRTETENTSGGASPRTGTASANAEIRAQ
jgi:MscS family membrane protein